MIFFVRAYMPSTTELFGKDERHEKGETVLVSEKGKRLKENNKLEWIEIENRVREEKKSEREELEEEKISFSSHE